MARRTVEDRNWKDIGSDANWQDHGGLWARNLAAGHYLVMRFENCREWGDGATGYHVELSEVRTDNPQLAEALECCGVKVAGFEDKDYQTDQNGAPYWYDGLGNQCTVRSDPLWAVEALHRYGALAPLFQESGLNVWKLIRAAKREAYAIVRDRSVLEDKLEQPVNAIGSTAAEYARGDVLSGILRGVSQGDPKCELMLKLGVR